MIDLQPQISFFMVGMIPTSRERDVMLIPNDFSLAGTPDATLGQMLT